MGYLIYSTSSDKSSVLPFYISPSEELLFLYEESIYDQLYDEAYIYGPHQLFIYERGNMHVQTDLYQSGKLGISQEVIQEGSNGKVSTAGSIHTFETLELTPNTFYWANANGNLVTEEIGSLSYLGKSKSTNTIQLS
jgi:hypothetical protein